MQPHLPHTIGYSENSLEVGRPAIIADPPLVDVALLVPKGWRRQ